MSFESFEGCPHPYIRVRWHSKGEKGCRIAGLTGTDAPQRWARCRHLRFQCFPAEYYRSAEDVTRAKLDPKVTSSVSIMRQNRRFQIARPMLLFKMGPDRATDRQRDRPPKLEHRDDDQYR